MGIGKKILSFGLYTGIFFLSAILSGLITFSIAIRGGKIYVPKLTGLSIDEAKKEASKLGLTIRIVAQRQEEGFAPGTVLSQDPYPGSEIKKGGEIQVSICKASQEVEVPDFTGKKVEEVRMEVEDVGLQVGNITQIFYPGVSFPQVIAQTPAAGQREERGGYVDLLVGLPFKESYVMPDFIGKSFEVVQIELTQAGFKVAPPQFIKYPGWEPGIIVQQLPFPGYKITKEQEISFKVTR